LPNQPERNTVARLLHKAEELAALEVERAVRRIRRRRQRSPVAALTSLAYILKGIRKKREHGSKAPRRHRDVHILDLVIPILTEMVRNAIAAAGGRTRPAGAKSASGG
jgi:hypothetical protein